MRHDAPVELRTGLAVEDSFLDEFAARHGIARIALFGSALRNDFGPSSDIDLLVEFLPGRVPGFLHLAQMELELESVVGRQVELRTYEDLSPYFRDRTSATVSRRPHAHSMRREDQVRLWTGRVSRRAIPHSIAGTRGRRRGR